ncbi:DALR domain-containing protein, partial [Patescibacteria group bacterium]
LNTPLTLSVLYELITETNKRLSEKALSPQKAKSILSLWSRMNQVFGLKISGQAEIPESVLRLAQEREQARQDKDFQKADSLRNMLLEKGYTVEDTSEGFKLKK